MVSFEIFVKAMPPSLSELKVLIRFCFAFKIPDDVAASSIQQTFFLQNNDLEVLSISVHKCLDIDNLKYFNFLLELSK